MQITIPAALKRFTQGRSVIVVPDSSLQTLLSTLCQHEPALKNCLLDAHGELQPYVNIYVNGKNLTTYPDNPLLSEQDEIVIITSLVGG